MGKRSYAVRKSVSAVINGRVVKLSMSTLNLIRLGVILVGLILAIASFWSHAAKKMNSDLAVAWCILGVSLVIMGAVPVFSAWLGMISFWTAVALFGVGTVTLGGAFELCLLISRALTQNKELAMQISLLLRENRALRDKMDELEKCEAQNDEENTLCG